MAVMIIGIFNAIGIQNKARDAQRKKDLNRIKIAFEEYYNDKGCYPNSILKTKLVDKLNCGSSSVFVPYLTPWPCDPNGEPYRINLDHNNTLCPRTFNIGTFLENKKDKDLRYINNDHCKPNYGVSSSNVLWYDSDVNKNSAFFPSRCDLYHL